MRTIKAKSIKGASPEEVKTSLFPCSCSYELSPGLCRHEPECTYCCVGIAGLLILKTMKMKLIIISFLSLTIGCNCLAQSNNKSIDALKNESATTIQSGYDAYKKIALSILGLCRVRL